MRFVRLALLTSALATAPAAAQTGTGGTGGGNLGQAAQAAGTLSTGTSSTTTSTTSSGGGGGGSSTTSTADTTAPPTISGATISGTSLSTASGGSVDRSNFLGGTYSNPYYQGLFSNSTGAPGQFGTPLYGTGTGTTSTTTTGRTGSTTSRTTTTSGSGNPFGTSGSPFGTAGGRTTTGGTQFGGAGGVSSQFGGQIVPLPRNIAYSASLRFATPAVAPAQRLADVQAVVARSSMMSNPAGVTVVQDGAAFVLRGSVASEDEARLAENMVRMTPGVREVRNELKFPVQ